MYVNENLIKSLKSFEPRVQTDILLFEGELIYNKPSTLC